MNNYQDLEYLEFIGKLKYIKVSGRELSQFINNPTNINECKNVINLEIYNYDKDTLEDLDELFTKLKILKCTGNNNLTKLGKLPNTLEKLNCSYNKITSLDNIPQKLEELYCGNNLLTSLDNLPVSLKILSCEVNNISILDNLPNGLKLLSCWFNNIYSLDNLPPNLEDLICYSNLLSKVDNLPNSLLHLNCGNSSMHHYIHNELIN
jgi:hypothetical protein